MKISNIDFIVPIYLEILCNNVAAHIILIIIYIINIRDILTYTLTSNIYLLYVLYTSITVSIICVNK